MYSLIIHPHTFLILFLNGCSDQQEGTPTRVFIDATTHTLSTARTEPVERIVHKGPYVLEYNGPHLFSTEEVVIEPLDYDDSAYEHLTAELDGGISEDVFNSLLIDRYGHEWVVVDYDPDMVRELVTRYDINHPPGDLNWEQITESYDTGAYALGSNWETYPCGFSDKWVYIPGTEVDLETLTSRERYPITDGQGFGASSAIIAPNLILTVGHAGPAVGGDAPDQVCRRVGTGNEECIDIVDNWQNDNSGCATDWELLLLSDSFTTPYYFDLASGSDSFLMSKTPRLGAYPTIRLGEEEVCGKNSLLEGERNTGIWYGITTKQVRLKITSGGNSSGGPYYFYNESQHRYKLFGIHQNRINLLVVKYTCGPKIPYWREEIISAAAALGVDL